MCVIMFTTKPCFEARNLNSFMDFFLLYIKSVSEMFYFYHTYVRRKVILFAFYGWRNTNPPGFHSVLLQVAQDTACVLGLQSAALTVSFSICE